MSNREQAAGDIFRRLENLCGWTWLGQATREECIGIIALALPADAVEPDWPSRCDEAARVGYEAGLEAGKAASPSAVLTEEQVREHLERKFSTGPFAGDKTHTMFWNVLTDLEKDALVAEILSLLSAPAQPKQAIEDDEKFHDLIRGGPTATKEGE